MTFALNALIWFLGKDGQQKLKTDIGIFNLDMGEQIKHDIEDNKIGEDTVVVKKPKTVADLLK